MKRLYAVMIMLCASNAVLAVGTTMSGVKRPGQSREALSNRSVRLAVGTTAPSQSSVLSVQFVPETIQDPAETNAIITVQADAGADLPLTGAAAAASSQVEIQAFLQKIGEQLKQNVRLNITDGRKLFNLCQSLDQKEPLGAQAALYFAMRQIEEHPHRPRDINERALKGAATFLRAIDVGNPELYVQSLPLLLQIYVFDKEALVTEEDMPDFDHSQEIVERLFYLQADFPIPSPIGVHATLAIAKYFSSFFAQIPEHAKQNYSADPKRRFAEDLMLIRNSDIVDNFSKAQAKLLLNSLACLNGNIQEIFPELMSLTTLDDLLKTAHQFTFTSKIVTDLGVAAGEMLFRLKRQDLPEQLFNDLRRKTIENLENLKTANLDNPDRLAEIGYVLMDIYLYSKDFGCAAFVSKH